MDNGPWHVTKPNIFCQTYRCGHPLGIRPPHGPRGEAPPGFVFIRTARGKAYAVAQLEWELADGRVGKATPHEMHLRAILRRRREQWGDEEEMLLTGDGWEFAKSLEQRFHGLRRRATAETDDEKAAVSAVLLGRILGDTPPPDPLGAIVRLRRWKKTARFDGALGKYQIARIEETGMVHAVHYLSRNGTCATKRLALPYDASPIKRGARGRCPRCRAVHPLVQVRTFAPCLDIVRALP